MPSGWLICPASYSVEISESVRPADRPDAPLVLVRARTPDVQYEIDAAHGKLWILANDSHVNFRIATADPARPGEWETLIAGSERTYLRGIHAHLIAGLENGTLRPVIGKEMPLSDARRAHEKVLEAGAYGKIVLVP